MQGTLNGLAAGVLLYLAAALVLSEFGAGTEGRKQLGRRAASFAALVLGAAVFSVLGNWA